MTNDKLNPKLKVNYSAISDENISNYFQYLINRVYKALCLRDDYDETLGVYLDSLLIELKGSGSLISQLKNDPKFISLLSTIQYLSENPNEDKAVFKREIFKCINIIETILGRYFGKEFKSKNKKGNN